MFAWLYAPTLYFSAAALLAVAVYAWRRRDVPGSSTYGYVLAAAAWWALMHALETETDTTAVKLGLHLAAWLGLLSTNVLNLRFLALYLRGDPALARRLILLWIVPAIALIALATNDWHHAFYTGYQVVNPPGVLALTPGPLLTATTLYSTTLGAIGALWLLVMVTRTQGAVRHRNRLLLAAALVPAPFVAVYWLRWTPADLTPVSFVLVAAFVAVAVYRYQLFQLLPVAQEMLWRDLRDGLLVLDLEHRVVSANPAWAALFGGLPGRGQPVREACAAQPELARALGAEFEPREIVVRVSPERVVEVGWSAVMDADGAPQGRLVLARDITQRTAAAAVIAEHERNLAVTAARRRFETELKDALAQVLRYVRGQITHAGDLIARGEVAPASALLARLDAIAGDADSDVLDVIAQSEGGPGHADFYLALRQYARQFGQVSGLYVALSLPDVPASVHLLPIVQAQVMRIIQEALNDIRARGGARTAQIIFARQGDEVQLTISDDGPVPERPPETNALAGLHARVAAIGGRCQIASVPGQGTTLKITVAVATPEAGPGPLMGLRVVLADPQALVLEGLRQILAAHGVDVVGETRDGATLVQLCGARRPDLALLDLRLERLSGTEAVARIVATQPEVRCVVLTESTEDADVTRALQSGVAGYLLKNENLSDFIEALVRLRQGERVFMPKVAAHLARLVAEGPAPAGDAAGPLTGQQADVLRMVAEGATYKEVGAQLHITERTVRYHMGQILDALNLDSRSKAIAYAYRVGLAQERRHVSRPEPQERSS